MSAPVEPPACVYPFSTEAGGLHYSWRGGGPGEKATTIAVYTPTREEWTLQPTIGPPPPGLCGGRCVSIANHLYCFGGYDGSYRFNDLHKLNLENFQWSNIPTDNPRPICKIGCGLVSMDERFLVCFGGYGISPTQPGSRFTRDKRVTNGCGWTNELHLFDVQEGVWSSPSVKGERPPPCVSFSFTKVDQDTVVLFGGAKPGYIRMNHVYLFNLREMEVTKVEPVQGDPWPVERSSHAACCLNYNSDHPKLLVSGGVGKGDKVLGDMWILDVDTGKWTKVTPPESVKPRYRHSTTATSLGPGLTEVLVFGGKLKSGGSPVAETTILRFECSLSVTRPPTEKWVLVDVAHNQTRGSRERLEEKREIIKQATHHSSSEYAQSPRDALHFSQDQRVKSLEQQLQAAEQRTQSAHQREQITQRHCQDAKRKAAEELQATQHLLEEANHHCEDAERRAAEERRQKQEVEQRAVDAEGRVQELITEIGRNQELITRLQEDLQRMERRAQLAEQQLEDTTHQKGAIECELEGKTKELAAHNTEVWRIPSNQVKTMKTIGSGGWGEVLEGTVRVAVKRLHIAILNQRNVERLQRETRLLAEVRHPNLVLFIGAVFDQSPLIVTELLDMNLREAYEQNQLRLGDRLLIFMDIARALDYLHQRYEPIIHRDVSAPNILLQQMPNNQWKGKVSDLGSANFLQQAQTKGEGNILYSPPEVIPRAYNPRRERIPQTTKIDVYSYGVLLCEVTTSRFPSQEDYWDMLQSVGRDHPLIHALIEHCTQERPSDRPTMEAILARLSQEKKPQI